MQTFWEEPVAYLIKLFGHLTDDLRVLHMTEHFTADHTCGREQIKGFRTVLY